MGRIYNMSLYTLEVLVKDSYCDLKVNGGGTIKATCARVGTAMTVGNACSKGSNYLQP